MLETIMNAIMPNIFEIVLTALSLVVARYIIPYIKNDFIPWLKDKRIYSDISKFVKAVEKLAETGVINKSDKKNKVVELLENKGIVVDTTVEAFIESCVKELDIVTSVVYEEIVETEVETN